MDKSIVVIDSGVGGLSILYQLKKMLPNNDFVYFADKKNLPYGNKNQEQLTKIADEGIGCADLFCFFKLTAYAGHFRMENDRWEQNSLRSSRLREFLER